MPLNKKTETLLFCTYLYKYPYLIQIIYTVVFFQVFLSNSKSCMISSNYLYLIEVICFVWFQVTNNNS